MSVVLVCFSGAPKVSAEAVKREQELDKYLESRVEGTLTFLHHHTHFPLNQALVAHRGGGCVSQAFG